MVTADMFLTELPLCHKYKRQTATGVICLQSSQTIWVLKGLVSRVFNKGEDFTLKPKCSVLDIFCLYVICCCLFLYIINSSSFCELSVFFLCTEFACVWVSLSQSKHLQVQFPLRELNTWNLEFPITRTFTSLWLLTVRYQVLHTLYIHSRINSISCKQCKVQITSACPIIIESTAVNP